MNTTKIATLEAQAKALRATQYAASQARNARKVGQTVRQLESIYREIDKLRRAG